MFLGTKFLNVTLNQYWIPNAIFFTHFTPIKKITEKYSFSVIQFKVMDPFTNTS